MHADPTLRAAVLGAALSLCAAGTAAAQPGTPIRIGQTLSGSLAATDSKLEDDTHYDFFRFTGRAGQRIVVEMTSEDFDAFMAVGPWKDGEFEAAESDDDGAGGTNARVRYTLPADGTYLIRANSLSAATGDYTVTMSENTAPPPPPPSAIRIGQTVTGSLAATDPQLESDDTHYDQYRFTATAGQRVEVTLAAENFDAYLSLGRLEDGSFDLIRSDDDGGDGTNAKLTVTLPEAGEYVIRANSVMPGETGDYSLAIRAVAVPVVPAPTPIRAGADVSGELSETDPLADDDTYYDGYVYRARAGERIVVTMTSEAFDTYLAIGTVTGGVWTQLEANDDGGEDGDGTNSRLTFTVPEAGAYVIRANALSEGSVGAYTLRVESGGGK